MKKGRSLKEREIYNEAIRDAMKEMLSYDGIIPEDTDRNFMAKTIQEKLSYKNPKPKPLVLIKNS